MSHNFQMYGFMTPQNTRNHIKPLKGSSNKSKSLDSLGRQMYEPLFKWHTSFTAILIRLEVVLHPTCQAILTPIKVTTNKLENVL
jgi:hypothetical protein